MGIELCDRQFRLPVYVRLQADPDAPGPPGRQTVPRPLSQQQLAQLVFQIVSLDQFIW